ncbi:selenobiotic family peptide radical SAM maturase [Desulfosarcina alkanivorans]|uniref:Selenobiotic family peptide radical SAM maturase n=1 Tax=Desulfosarcina alkanivorans TaxID=571177 RepID=A0A5K7YJX9_9BACT|nr:thio(seleno)oxazole modification radical SAM maturase SbtM [Desulfosarcina alkanivorans]BBO68813.1 selenobiotic family peptide radical SAM maturase [Desulfosarcina alkanivorans]
MHPSPLATYENIFSTCRRTLGSHTWGRVLAAMDEDLTAEAFPDTVASLSPSMDLPGYLVDLARLEWLLHQKQIAADEPIPQARTVSPNPTLTIVPVRWKHLAAFIRSNAQGARPHKEAAYVMIWRHPKSGELHYREPAAIDLLALKLVVEQIDPLAAAEEGKVTPGDIQNAIDQAIARGVLLAPGTRIRRTPMPAGRMDSSLEPFLATDAFTLQWHVTQACDLHCRHCYDRSDRKPMPAEMAMAILNMFYDFCRRMHVRGQVTFTGGNPLLYPHFDQVYRKASDYGFGIAILGNPTPIDRIGKLMEIAPPLYFQISLEGLAEHNDYIRGKGHFNRSLAFLDALRSLGIYTMVMLTLTRDNLDQVLPLAELLRKRADFFTFNRLSTVGEGAALLMPETGAFESFLRRYATAAARNPKMGLKDNLINIIRRENDQAPFGGCTGHGCGAAFNFMALLPDGEVHACRKFPSLIGNVLENDLYDIYHTPLARRYRTGSQACRNCGLNIVCRGCLAITHSLGLDIFTDKDPFCFAPPSITGK